MPSSVVGCRAVTMLVLDIRVRTSKRNKLGHIKSLPSPVLFSRIHPNLEGVGQFSLEDIDHTLPCYTSCLQAKPQIQAAFIHELGMKMYIPELLQRMP